MKNVKKGLVLDFLKLMDNQNPKLTVKFPCTEGTPVFVSRERLLQMSLYYSIAEGFLTERIIAKRDAEFYPELEITNSRVQILDFMSALEFLNNKDLSPEKKLEELRKNLKSQENREKIARCFQFSIYYELIKHKYKFPSEYQILTAAATFLNVKLKIQRKGIISEILPSVSFSRGLTHDNSITLIRKYDKFIHGVEEQEFKAERGLLFLQLNVNQVLYKQFLKFGSNSVETEWGSMNDRYQSTLATPRKQFLHFKGSTAWDENEISRIRSTRDEENKEGNKSKLSMSLIEVCFDLSGNVEEESRSRILTFVKKYQQLDAKAILLAKFERKYITLDTCKDTVPLEGILKNIAQKFQLTDAANLFLMHQEQVESPRCSQCRQVLNAQDLINLLPHLDASQIRGLYTLHYEYSRKILREPNPLYLQKVVDHLIATSKVLEQSKWKQKFQKLDKKIQKVLKLYKSNKKAIVEIKNLKHQIEQFSSLARSTMIHQERTDISILKGACMEGLRLITLLSQQASD